MPLSRLKFVPDKGRSSGLHPAMENSVIPPLRDYSVFGEIRLAVVLSLTSKIFFTNCYPYPNYIFAF